MMPARQDDHLTLLERAKANHRHRTPRTYTVEDYELVRAWIRGDIGVTDVAKAIGVHPPSGAYNYLAFVMRDLLRKMDQEVS